MNHYPILNLLIQIHLPIHLVVVEGVSVVAAEV
jgi:hypothetical protein